MVSIRFFSILYRFVNNTYRSSASNLSEKVEKPLPFVQRLIKGDGFVEVPGWARPVNKSAWNTYTGKYKLWTDRHKIYRSPVHIAMNWTELEIDHGD